MDSFGSGGGLILLPYMTILLKKDEVQARATTILCIFYLVLICTFFYYNENILDWNITIRCAFGGIVGGFIGTKLLNNLDKKLLQISFIIYSKLIV